MATVMDNPKRVCAFDVIHEGDVVIVRFEDNRPLEPRHVAATEHRLVELLDSRRRPAVIAFDLSGVDFVSSPGLAMFIKLRKRAQRLNHRLRMCHPNAHVFEVFQVTRLDELFEFSL
jgi:anti-anti-sigma factor